MSWSLPDWVLKGEGPRGNRRRPRPSPTPIPLPPSERREVLAGGSWLEGSDSNLGGCWCAVGSRTSEPSPQWHRGGDQLSREPRCCRQAAVVEEIMVIKTRVTEMLGIEAPIILGGMTGVGTPELCAAVSNAGGLGTFAAHNAGTPENLKVSGSNF